MLHRMLDEFAADTRLVLYQLCTMRRFHSKSHGVKSSMNLDQLKRFVNYFLIILLMKIKRHAIEL